MCDRNEIILERQEQGGGKRERIVNENIRIGRSIIMQERTELCKKGHKT